jgi:hypothetical protein
MISKGQEFIWNHGWHGFTRIGAEKKAMLARPVPGLGGLLPRPLQASLRLPFQSPSSICFADDQHWPRPSADDGSQRSEFYCILEQQGRSRSERGDSETGESASFLVRESDSEAPAWLAKCSPAAALPFDSLVPTRLALRAAFGSLPSGRPAACLCISE